MGILLCEQNFRDVWSRNESGRAEIGQILHTDTHAAKLEVRRATKDIDLISMHTIIWNIVLLIFSRKTRSDIIHFFSRNHRFVYLCKNNFI